MHFDSIHVFSRVAFKSRDFSFSACWLFTDDLVRTKSSLNISSQEYIFVSASYSFLVFLLLQPTPFLLVKSTYKQGLLVHLPTELSSTLGSKEQGVSEVFFCHNRRWFIPE